MTRRAAIVTGGLRGLGKAMTFGLAQAGHSVLAVGHLSEDVEGFLAEAEARSVGRRVLPLVADVRKPSECDRVVEAALNSFDSADILVNCAGLTFTYIWPDKFRRTSPMRFWELSDEIVQNVMDTNYVAADQMARRIAPLCVARGWGRIVNVTTKLTTMNQVGATPYGSSKAALEMATEVWAREAEGTGAHGQHRQSGGRRQYARHGRGNARMERQGDQTEAGRAGADGAAAAVGRVGGG
jgi:NAD(P)-dependent dehydrogenase (short-subunit alcohol dehydrogenase family)